MTKRSVGAAVVAFALVGTPGMAEPLRIAHNQSLPPLLEVHEGKSVGLAVDLVQAAATRAGVDVQFVPVAIEQQMPTLQDGRADALLSADTPERRQSLDFSAPVLMTGGALYVRAPNPTPESLAALAGKIVVTPRAGPLADFIRKTAPAVDLVVTRDYEECLTRLVTREADAAALNVSAGGRIAARLYPGQITLPRIMFHEQPFAIGTPMRWRDSTPDSPRSAPMARGNRSTIAGPTNSDISEVGRKDNEALFTALRLAAFAVRQAPPSYLNEILSLVR